MNDVIKLCNVHVTACKMTRKTGLHYFIVVVNLCIMGSPWPWPWSVGLGLDLGLECFGLVNITVGITRPHKLNCKSFTEFRLRCLVFTVQGEFSQVILSGLKN